MSTRSVMVVLLVSVAVCAAAAAAAGAASLPLGPSTTIEPPSNVLTEPSTWRGSTEPPQLGSLEAIACPPAGACAAVGSYIDTSRRHQAMVVDGAGTEWEQAIEVQPANEQFASSSLDSVACPAAGQCVAVGTSSESPGIAVEQDNGGVWGRAIPIPISPVSVACDAPRSCVAIGNAVAGSGPLVGIAEHDGTWGGPQPIASPANADGRFAASVYGLACQPQGPCTAVGEYTDTSVHARPMGLYESKAAWAPAIEIATPEGVAGTSHLWSNACPAVGACTAVGVAFGPTQSLISASESAGVWSSVFPIPMVPEPFGEPIERLTAVACRPFGACTAVGADQMRRGGTNAIAATGAGTAWMGARVVTAPANAGPDPGGQLQAVSCPDSGPCLATGFYRTAADREQAMAAAERSPGGGWSPASPVTAPPTALNGETGYQSELRLLACPATGVCSALGSYKDSAGRHMMAGGLADTGVISLRSSGILVRRAKRASIRLFCPGTVPCAGTLRLIARPKPHARASLTIGRGRVAIQPGTTVAVEIGLDAAGRRLLTRTHGRRPARLLLAESGPVPWGASWPVELKPRG